MKKKKSRRKYRIRRLLVLIVLVLLLIGSAGGLLYYHNSLTAPSHENQPVIFTVTTGESNMQVLNGLYEAGLIKNKLASEIHMRLEKPAIKANTYALNKNMSFPKILEIIQQARSSYVVENKLTIKEGARLKNIAKLVAKALHENEEDILKEWSDPAFIRSLAKDYWFLDPDEMLAEDVRYPLEGYLYPDTYYGSGSDQSLDRLTRLFLDEMKEKLTPYRTSITKMGMTPHQFLTLASIVQCESLYEEDMPKIAGVFINRLENDMRLQSDVTVNYALDRTGVNVSQSMMKTDSKYNTYVYKGLPVGPIATVQQKVIKATANYTKHDYYYFFAKKDGSVIYSKTYKEHEQAVKENKWY
ncbi:MAG: endolytic transglycosylase MltG [bacterium]